MSVYNIVKHGKRYELWDTGARAMVAEGTSRRRLEALAREAMREPRYRIVAQE